MEGLWFLVSMNQQYDHVCHTTSPTGSISDVDPVSSQQTSLYRNLLLHGRR